MALVPRCMSTQHPDNVTVPLFAGEDGVLKGEGEIAETVHVFQLGCDEQMWDSEGKDVDAHVVQKLLATAPDFFRSQRRLGSECVVTLRVPNPAIEKELRKSLVEALTGIPAAWDVARGFYGQDMAPPIQEVILPFTTSAEDLLLLEAYYRQCIVEAGEQSLAGRRLAREWIGDFHPKAIRVIPLIEDMDHLLTADALVEEFLRGRNVPYQRVFLARSDPALNYGALASELLLKVALQQLASLEREMGIPLYPIIGAGSAPFRGHLTPKNVERALREYPSMQTMTIQSAFKYDYEEATVQEGVRQILAHERRPPVPVDEERARDLIERCAAEYRRCIRRLAPVISELAAFVPRRRERRQHIGLFGYSRSLDGSEDIHLPRAIPFCAALYSIGVPPEVLGLAALREADQSFLRETYPSLEEDLAVALAYANEFTIKELLGEEYAAVAARFQQGVDRIHLGLTTAVWESLRSGDRGRISQYLVAAAALRRFLG